MLSERKKEVSLRENIYTFKKSWNRFSSDQDEEYVPWNLSEALPNLHTDRRQSIPGSS